MRERAFTFGSHGNLLGVLTEPDAVEAAAIAPAVLLANIGVNHRVGPNRLWVDLARRLACQGSTVLRFDLSGLGDSLPRPGDTGDLERAVLDFREAMDFITGRGGPKTFAVVGLCSGADSAHAVTMADPRVRAVVYIDGFVWRTWGFRLHYWTLRRFELSRWRRAIRRRSLRHGGPREVGEAREIFQRDLLTPEQVRADLSVLLARGTAVLALYTGGLKDYAYRNQIRDMVGKIARHSLFATDYFRRADHLFSDVVERDRLLSRLAAWLHARFLQSGR